MNVFLLPYPPQHIRFYCVLLHTHELSIYILCRFVILGEEHGYSPHTDILKHGNSSRMSIRHLCNFSIAQHSKHTQIHTHTHTHTRQHIILHTHTHTRLQYSASVRTWRIIYETRFYFAVYQPPVFYFSSGSNALLCICIGDHIRTNARKERKLRK